LPPALFLVGVLNHDEIPKSIPLQVLQGNRQDISEKKIAADQRN